MGLAMKAQTGLFLARIIVRWGFKSAFNEIERAAIIEVIRDEPTLRFVLRDIQFELQPQSPDFAQNGRGGLQVLDYRKVNGGQ